MSKNIYDVAVPQKLLSNADLFELLVKEWN